MASADQLAANLEGLGAASFANEAERVRARDTLFEALRRVQSPWDVAWEHNWVNGSTSAAIKTLIDAGVFAKWAEAGWHPITCPQLADLTGAETQLLQDTYTPTAWAKTIVSDSAFASCYGGFYHELNNPMFRTLPYFLKKTGFRNPTDVENCNLQYMLGNNDNLFYYISNNPLLASDFNDAMECHSKYNLTPWPEIYPTDKLVASAKEDRALVVDIGGNKGHDLEKFRLRHPEIPPGSLVLQDLPDILKWVEASKTITVQPYDFFTPQPIKGARAYFMHNVLHDWTDELATQILRTVAAAMERGYSTLLIHESLVSNERPLARVTASDLTVMACLAAKERTEDDWRSLIAGAGMRLVKIWRPVQAVESVIEVEVE